MTIQKIFEQVEFDAFGVKIGVICNDPHLLNKIKIVLPLVIPDNLLFVSNQRPEHTFKLERLNGSAKVTVYKNNEKLFNYTNDDSLIEYLSSQIRITVAEFAESKVFIHAGAVGWKDSAIIIPGTSYSGKTTLVSELIKAGAVYYSDEYAVLDEEGNLHPYPKMLSMRGIIDDFQQVETAPEVFGARIGSQPIPIKMILITQYKKNGRWKPQIMKTGEGLMEVLKHTIPIRLKPEFVLNVLKKTASRAIITKSKRGEANIAVPNVLEYFEANCF